MGESTYAPLIDEMLSDLNENGLTKKEEGGAVCIPAKFFSGTSKKEPPSMIVVKSDGTYLYATTDLAALRYRLGIGSHLPGETSSTQRTPFDRIIYVVDTSQSLHFSPLFSLKRLYLLPYKGQIQNHSYQW